MNPLVLSLAAGVLIGLLYGLLKVRSPAPPAIALVGLLGMLLGGAAVHAGWPAAKSATSSLQPVAPSATVSTRTS